MRDPAFPNPSAEAGQSVVGYDGRVIGTQKLLRVLRHLQPPLPSEPGGPPMAAGTV